MLIPFYIIDLNQRAATSDNIDVAQVVKAGFVLIIVVDSRFSQDQWKMTQVNW